ncbi:hypothetical protein V6N11_040039 [Hibiscus sabdariffa]|uniref:Transmembrane protein n=1 Tax=Hibiscus sabdariffa TaxID=183260 RepID=A0ABR2RGA1_9ROSI
MSISILFQNLLPPSPSRLNPCLKYPTSLPPIPSRHLTFPVSDSGPLHFRTRNFLHFNSRLPSPKAYDPDSSIATSPEENPTSNAIHLDSFLTTAELFCIFSSAVVSVIYVVSDWKGVVLYGIWRSIMVWRVLGLVGGMAIGAWIRTRQWRRICVETAKGGGKGVNLVGRIEKLEEDLKSSVTIISVLSRQLEKLGVRFRVTRKALKQPIEETAALAQKNSEVTRALAAQEDILEKELKEIQKVLLAMQEQQQKQLELILAIAKSGKLFEDKRQPSQGKDTVEACKSTEEAKQMEVHQSQPFVCLILQHTRLVDYHRIHISCLGINIFCFLKFCLPVDGLTLAALLQLKMDEELEMYHNIIKCPFNSHHSPALQTTSFLYLKLYLEQWPTLNIDIVLSILL